MSTEIEFVSESSVQLVNSCASDLMVVQAARVSTMGADSLESGESAGLIDYLMRSRHGSPYESSYFRFLIDTPIFVAREFMRHRIACVSGDTAISFRNSGSKKNGVLKSGYRKKTIKQHYEDFNNGVTDSLGRTRKLSSILNAKVASLDESTMRMTMSHVEQVLKGEPKEMFLVTTFSGMEIKTSIDHRFFTPYGWQRLEELVVGDEVYVQRRSLKKTHRRVPPATRNGIQVWVTHIKEFVIANQGKKCRNCGSLDGPWRVDHIIPIVTDLTKAFDLDNLQVLCVKCERDKTTREQALAVRTGNWSSVSADAIKSIESVGIEDSYDLSVAAPHHNFLANGFIVHNSYSEWSGRYSQMQPRFYIPKPGRPLIQVGKAGEYSFEPGTTAQNVMVKMQMEATSTDAWYGYQELLDAGIAREVARMVLPLNLMTSFYVSLNARGLMNFLSLRVLSQDCTYPTYPMYEIDEVARKMEERFAEKMPHTHGSFVKHGRVSP